MRAIKIDPANKTIEEIELTFDPNRSLGELRSIIGAEELELIPLDKSFNLLADLHGEQDNSISIMKQKVLDLAIHGKLVPQDPNDEPASELLKKIKAEKDALVNAGKMKRDKHESFIFRGDDNCYHENVDGKSVDITDMIPFNLPDSWEWVMMSAMMCSLPAGRIPAYC